MYNFRKTGNITRNRQFWPEFTPWWGVALPGRDMFDHQSLLFRPAPNLHHLTAHRHLHHVQRVVLTPALVVERDLACIEQILLVWIDSLSALIWCSLQCSAFVFFFINWFWEITKATTHLQAILIFDDFRISSLSRSLEVVHFVHTC